MIRNSTQFVEMHLYENIILRTLTDLEGWVFSDQGPVIAQPQLDSKGVLSINEDYLV